MAVKAAAVSIVCFCLMILPCFAQHDPQVIFEGKPPDKTTWWAFRITPSFEMEEYYFSTDNTGTFAGIFDTSHGDVLYYSLNILSDEDKATLAGGNCIMGNDPLLIEGDKYFISRWPDIGTLYVRQIEEGEKWLFRVGDALYFKNTPALWGTPPAVLNIELLDDQLRVFNSIEMVMFPWQLAEGRTGKVDGEPKTIIRLIGSASDEEEFGSSDLPEGIRWLTYPLDDGSGTVMVWSATEVGSCRITVDGVENQSEAMEQETLHDLPQLPRIRLEGEE